jgi:purine-nucleoside phosphorylase
MPSGTIPWVAALEYLESRLKVRPRTAVVLGSGLGDFANELDHRVEIAYGEIPGWPPSTAQSHAGKLIVGTLAGQPLAVMAGRNHLYEGYTPAQVTFGVRVLAKLGVRSLVLTNAAGGINLSYGKGALVIISDHINLQGSNPLVGANDDSCGPRFPDMTEAYDAGYRRIALEAAAKLGIEMAEGVYAAVLGPSYETPAEIRYLRVIGADLVGMSTVPETIVANHMGVKVLAISCVTNMAAGVLPVKLSHEEVLEVGRQVRERFVLFLKTVLPRLEPANPPMTNDPLIAAALAARENAWAPFSNFRVGAALEDETGRIFTGCNVENATYGLSVCAERTAVLKAISEGARKFRRVAVSADTDTLTPPCGACRQILWEFCGDIEVTLVNLHGKTESFQMRDLFPRPFDVSFIR